MTDIAYMTGRRKYARPQGMLWADNPGTIVTSSTDIYYIPNGYEIGTDPDDVLDNELANQFLILSDNNRSAIGFNTERIENRQRMINGRMRSYHIADKLTINVSWDMLPSRSYSSNPLFTSTGKSTFYGQFGSPAAPDAEYTTDGGAGGVEILDWYNNHPGSFWVYLSYDNYKNFEQVVNEEALPTNSQYNQLNKYSQIVEVFFADFNYTVQRRGSSNFDFWNISLSLEEV
jgi:hypothetical protein